MFYKRYAGHGSDTPVLLNDDLIILEPDRKRLNKAEWYKVNVHTVQHTGTNFIIKVLHDAGWRYYDSHHWNRRKVPESRFKEDFVISTIRRPEDVWVTWSSRKRNEDFFEVWDTFDDAFLKNPNLYIVPVDTMNKELHLQRLASKLRCTLKTDWKPVASQPHNEIEPRDLSDIYELPVVRHFYGDTYASKRI